MSRFLFDLVRGMIRLLPYPAFRAFAGCVTWMLYATSPRLRRQSMESLTIAFGDGFTPREKRAIGRKAFFHLTLGLADLVYYIARPQRARDAFILYGVEHLARARADGRGAVVAVAHFGPFVAMLFKLLHEGYPVKVVMKPPRNKALRDEIAARASLFVPKPIYSTPLRVCVTACFAALRANEILVMPVDQNYGATGRVFVNFFGRLAATAAGPAAYALKTGAPLLTAFALPLPDGRWQVVIEPVPLNRDISEPAALYAATQAVTTRVEAMARRYPELWSWMHRRWKAVPRPDERQVWL